MHFKSIVLQLLQDRQRLHDRLRRERMLLPAVEAYALELKTRHEARKEELSRARPGSDPGQIASEALELALEDLRGSLPPESSTDEGGPLSLDGAMAFLRRHTPPG